MQLPDSIHYSWTTSFKPYSVLSPAREICRCRGLNSSALSLSAFLSLCLAPTPNPRLKHKVPPLFFYFLHSEYKPEIILIMAHGKNKNCLLNARSCARLISSPHNPLRQIPRPPFTCFSLKLRGVEYCPQGPFR